MNNLTLPERATLEARYDGPIPADAPPEVVLPALRTPHRLHQEIKFMQVQMAFYQRNLDDLHAEIATLQADRDQTYNAAEWDRKTRHIAYMMRQCQSPTQMVEVYAEGIKAAEAELGVPALAAE